MLLVQMLKARGFKTAVRKTNRWQHGGMPLDLTQLCVFPMACICFKRQCGLLRRLTHFPFHRILCSKHSICAESFERRYSSKGLLKRGHKGPSLTNVMLFYFMVFIQNSQLECDKASGGLFTGLGKA